MEGSANDPANAALTPLNVMRYVRAFWRRKWIVLGVAVLITGLTGLHTLRKPKVFAASTSLIIDVTAPRVLDSDVKELMGDERSNYWFNKEYYATQNQVITSRAVATRVAEKLGLQHDASFLGLAHLQDEKARLQAMQLADAAGMLQARISVIPVKDSRVVNIAVEDLDSQRAALLANEVAQAYMAENLALRLRTTETATQWLEERKVELERVSQTSELALYDFKKDSDMLSVAPESKKSSVSERITSYEIKLTQVRTEALPRSRARVEAIRQLQKNSQPGDETWAEAVPGASDPAIQELKRRFVEQRAACVELGERYLAEHPKMLECNSKLAVVREDFVRSLTNVVRKAETELAQAVAEEKNMVRLLAAAQDESFQLGKRQIEFDRMNREAENDRRLYESVLRRLKDIELSGLLRTTNVRVLDAARPNYAPIKPDVQRTVMLALLVGVLAGLRRGGAAGDSREHGGHPGGRGGAARAGLPGLRAAHGVQGREPEGPGLVRPPPAEVLGGRVLPRHPDQPAVHVSGQALQDAGGDEQRAAGGQVHLVHLPGRGHGPERQPRAAAGHGHAPAAAAQGVRRAQ